MAEFSKALSDPSVPSLPQVQTNTGSDVGDIASALNFGVSLFNRANQKAEDTELVTSVDKLRDIELQVLEQNKGNPQAQFKAARKVDATIKELFGSDPRKAERVRTALATVRGGRVKNTIQQGLVDESVKAERDISSQFNDIKSLNPVFVNLNLETMPDGSVTTEAKQDIIALWKDHIVEQQGAELKKNKALTDNRQDEFTRVNTFYDGVSKSLGGIMPQLLGNLSKTLDNLVGGEDNPETSETFSQVKRNAMVTLTSQKAQVQQEFGRLRSMVTSPDGIKLLEARQEAIIKSLDTWGTLIEGSSLDEAKQRTQLATSLQQKLKLKAMQVAPVLAGISEGLGTSVTTALVQEVMVREPDLRSQLVGGTGADILSLANSFSDEGDKNLNTLGQVVAYPQGGASTPESRSMAYKSALLTLKNNAINSLGDKDKETIAKTTLRFFNEASQAPELSGAQNLLGQMLDPKLGQVVRSQPKEVQEAFKESTSFAAYRVLTDPKHGLQRVMDRLKNTNIKFKQGEDGKIRLLPLDPILLRPSAGARDGFFRAEFNIQEQADKDIKLYNQAIDILLENKDTVVATFGEEGYNRLLGIQPKQDSEDKEGKE